MTVFKIKEEYKALDELLNEFDSETGEFINSNDDLKSFIDELDGNRNEKLDNIERLKRSKLSKVQALSDEIKRLQQFKKQIENTCDRLTFLQSELTCFEKIETDFYKFSSRKSKSLLVEDESLIPNNWFKVVKSLNKNELKKFIQAGNEVAGAVIQEKISLSVR